MNSNVLISTKGRNSFSCLAFIILNAKATGLAFSPSLSLSCGGGRIVNKMKKPTMDYVDVFKSNESFNKMCIKEEEFGFAYAHAQNWFCSLLANPVLNFLFLFL